jgi:hypothetical protein
VNQHDDRHFRQAQRARGQQTTVAGDNPGVAVHQDRRVEAELRDTRRDLRNLGIRMGALIPRVRHEATHGPDLDAPCQSGRNGNRLLDH